MTVTYSRATHRDLYSTLPDSTERRTTQQSDAHLATAGPGMLMM